MRQENLTFDSYFDMVYFINLPRRLDRYENVMSMFTELNITKYFQIIPDENVPKTSRLDSSGHSCKLAHMKCLQHAIDNNYNTICIFEDDICFNQSDATIKEDLVGHLNECFNFMSANSWDLFYFDNIIEVFKKNREIEIIYRYKSDGTYPIKKIIGKRYAHSYAITGDAKNKLLSLHKSNNIRNDQNLGYIKLDKYCYTKGIFDQLLKNKTDNRWESAYDVQIKFKDYI